jgi:hypothetical protein
MRHTCQYLVTIVHCAYFEVQVLVRIRTSISWWKTVVISIYTTRTLKHHIKHAVYMYYEKCLLFKKLNIHINITKKFKTEITIQPSCFLSEWCLPSGGDTCIFTFVFALSGAIHVCRLLYSVDVHCWIWSVHHWGYFK